MCSLATLRPLGRRVTCLYLCEGEGGDERSGGGNRCGGRESPRGRWSDGQGMTGLPLYLGAVLRSDSY